ncbi:prolipoprotein diacylglyceryl transferase, partial [Salmonella enterica]|nr:prolipoprotein diacylglyceryl transferase [Salmonella enterica]
GLVILLVLRRQKFLRAGELFMSYFIWYSIGRFFIEALRTDSLGFQAPQWVASMVNGLWSPMTAMGFEQGYLDPAYGNVRISQLLAIGIIVVAIVFIVVRRMTGKADVRYSDPIVSSKVPSESADDMVHTGPVAGKEDTVTPVSTKEDLKQAEEKKE